VLGPEVLGILRIEKAENGWLMGKLWGSGKREAGIEVLNIENPMM
jgi:hypothetical protein